MMSLARSAFALRWANPLPVVADGAASNGFPRIGRKPVASAKRLVDPLARRGVAGRHRGGARRHEGH